MQVTIIGSSEEIHDMLDRLSGTEVLDDMDSRLMGLHQKVSKLEKSIPDPLKMWEAINEHKKKPKQ